MAEHNHEQSSSLATWAINHGLNSDSVVIDVMINDGPNSPDVDKVLVAVEKVDNNNLNVKFSEAHTGYTRVVA